MSPKYNYFEDDWYDIPDFDYAPMTEWERQCSRLKVDAPDPDDLCEGCGRSHRLCDCFETES